MLNTFRVIFVDHGGFIIPNPSDCSYDQSSDRGYYSFDHGQPDGIAGNYAYDNRSINDWYRKYGVRDPDSPVGGDSTLFPPNNSTRVSDLPLGIGTEISDLLQGKTGGLMASAGMTSPGKDEDGAGVNLLGQDEANLSDGAPNYFYMRKGFGATLDLRTPSYFFGENGSIRNTNKTKATDFDSQYDLSFDTNPSTPVADNEINLSDSDDYPKWIYIGLVGAGGPAGAQMQVVQTTGTFCANPIGSNTMGLCDSWFNNENVNTQCPDLCRAANSTFIMSQNYSGLQSAAGQGGRAGIFLRACSAPLNSDNTRKTLVVRLVQIGKGGVETFDDSDRAFNENAVGGTNKAKTVFPTYDERKTVAEIYVVPNNNETSLGEADRLVTVEVDGGKAAIMRKYTVGADCQDFSGYQEFYCAECSGDYEQSGTVDNQTCINRDAALFSDEIYDDDNTAEPPTGDNRAPAYRIIEGQYAKTNPGHYEIKEAIPFSSCPADTTLTDPCETPSIADPIFPQELIDQGIYDQSDWFTAAGGIQETPETVERTGDSFSDYFGLGSDFIFYGNTEYVLVQEGFSSQDVIIPTPLPDTFPPSDPDRVVPTVKYFRQILDGDTSYEEVTASEYAETDLSQTFRVKMVLTFSKNSLLNEFKLTTTNSTLPIEWEFEFRRSTDQLLARPGLPGVMKATMVYAGDDIPIGNGSDDFAEGVGGNGGGVFVGWGPHVNNAAEGVVDPGDGEDGGGGTNQGPAPWNDFPLVPGDGFGNRVIQPHASLHNSWRLDDDAIGETIYTNGLVSPIDGERDYRYADYDPNLNNFNFYERVRLGYEGTYGQVSSWVTGEGLDTSRRGYDVAPIARFTEMPEITREGDFFVTLQAYHMEGIHKVTFIMDGGDPIDVYAPIDHPDSLGTEYDNSGSGYGKGYREYMVRVDTSNMDHNTSHEIRAIVWPNSGYPLILQGEQADKRVVFSSGDVPEQNNFYMSKYRITPTVYPWISNTYPEGLAEFRPRSADDNGETYAEDVTVLPNDEQGEFTIYDDPQFSDTQWTGKPGGPIVNFEGRVDGDGNPAWWIESDLAHTVGYHGFWFRYQDSEQRKTVYLDPSYTGGNSDGTRQNPYKNVDDFMEDVPFTVASTVVDPDYYSARVILMATNTNGVYTNDSVPQTHKYFSTTNPVATGDFCNALDDDSGRNSAQNPSCQVLTIEADPEWIQKCMNSGEGYWNPELELAETNNEIHMMANDGGWGKNTDEALGNGQDDNGGDINHSSIHFKNLRFVHNYPSDDQGSLFEPSTTLRNIDDDLHWGQRRVKTMMLAVDSCRVGSFTDNNIGDQLNYLDGNGAQTGDKKVIWPGFRLAENPASVQKSQDIYDDVLEVPTDRSQMRSVAGPLPVVWEKREDTLRINGENTDVIMFERVWDGDRFPRADDYIAQNLLSGVLKDGEGDYKDLLLNWTPKDPDALSREELFALDSVADYPDGFYKSYLEDQNRPTEEELPEGIRNFGFVEGDRVFCLKSDTSIWYVNDTNNQVGQVGTKGPDSIGQYDFGPLEGEEGLPTKKTDALNPGSFGRKMLEGDYVGVNAFCFNTAVSSYSASRRFTGINTVKNFIEVNCEGDTAARATGAILNVKTHNRSIHHYSGKRLLTNSSNTQHGDIQQFDQLNNDWMDNRISADVHMAFNAYQLAHMSSEGGTSRRTSAIDSWRWGHKTRNQALVNIIADSDKTAATWNYYEPTDHLYVRGWRVRRSSFAHRVTAGTKWGMPLTGEKADPRMSHVYFADMQQGSLAWKIHDSANVTLEPAALTPGVYPVPFTIPGTNEIYNPYGWVRVQTRSPEGGDRWSYSGNKENYPFEWTNSPNYPEDWNGPTPNPIKTSPLNVANDFRWFKVYEEPVNDTVNTVIADDPQMTSSSYNDYDGFAEKLRTSFRNCVVFENSNFNFGTHIFDIFGSGGSKVAQRPVMDAKFFGEGSIPEYDVVNNLDPDEPSNANKLGATYSIGAPRGVPAPNSTVVDATGKQTSYIPTIVGSPDEVKSYAQGFSAPMSFNDYNWGTNGNWNAPQWTVNGFDYVGSNDATVQNGLETGAPVTYYYPYDFRDFFGIIENGGWNYTKHWPGDYTPHKL